MLCVKQKEKQKENEKGTLWIFSRVPHGDFQLSLFASRFFVHFLFFICFSQFDAADLAFVFTTLDWGGSGG